jgi:GT2 family glycosyltransferase
MVSGQEAIHVVIPTWRGREHVTTLLESLAGQTCPPASILVVDGGSDDGTEEAAKKAGAGFLNLGENRGFAFAVNRGIERIGTGRIAVLNNDIRLAADWLERMSKIDASFAVGKVLAWDKPSRLDATWDLLSESGIPMRAGHGQPDGVYWNQSRQISLAPWTAIVVSYDYWKKTGGLDESLESYMEDIDIGMRGLALGFRGAYEPAAVAWHRGSATFGAWHPRQVRLSSRNQLTVILRHGRPRWWKVIVGQGLWGLAAARHGCLAAWWQGKREALKQRPARTPSPMLAELESEIFEIGRATGFDRFWRWYWALNL